MEGEKGIDGVMKVLGGVGEVRRGLEGKVHRLVRVEGKERKVCIKMCSYCLLAHPVSGRHS